jgi:hypothetical protein
VSPISDALIDHYAESCVNEMGDIFWDYEPERDDSGQFADPYQVAARAVRQTLRAFAEENHFDSSSAKSTTEAGESIIVVMGMNATDEEGTTTLAKIRESSEDRAAVVLQLARQYGAGLLRDALSVAEKLRIEVGEFQ